MHVSIRFYLVSLLWLPALWTQTAYATQWFTLKKNSQSTLMVDKQSITEETPNTKAWVKVEYRTPQKNTESVDRIYNNARALWYFECKTRKAATVQVFQYEDQELVYSAGIDPKQADFVEPLPESEVEVALQYVCQRRFSDKPREETKPTEDKSGKQAEAKPAAKTEAKSDAQTAKTTDSKTAPAQTGTTDKKNGAQKDKALPAEKPGQESKESKESKEKTGKAEEKLGEKSKESNQDKEKDSKDKKSGKKEDKAWSYQGDSGPEKWASLHPDFHTCGDGTQQSPIALDNTITAALKPLKKLQKFPLKSISRQAHGLSIDAGAGNMMVLDQLPYQLKTLSFHMPAEHKIKRKSYAAELQMLHEDKNNHRVIIAVLFEEGPTNPVLEKLLGNLPKEGETNKALTLRVTPADLMPAKPAYFRYSGSLTTPPCDEGVQWIVMKEAVKMSSAQLQALQTALGGGNQRPLQEVRGRMILE